MSYFKAIMHQIRFRLGLDPTRQPTVLPGPLAKFKGTYLYKGRKYEKKGKEGEREKESRGREKTERREEEERGREERGRAEGMVASWLLGDGRPWINVLLVWRCHASPSCSIDL